MAALAGRHLLLFGPGYVARAVAGLAQSQGARVSAVLRDPSRADAMRASGVVPVLAGTGDRLTGAVLEGVTDLLISAPPLAGGCPALAALGGQVPPGVIWAGYYSSTAVYGDCGGDWIDESRAPAPVSADARARLIAEAEWQDVAARQGVALDILRIAGIYGPEGRNVLAQLRGGQARAILKPGQVFNRIHRDDIAAATLAALASPDGLRLTNLADGAPSAASDLLAGVAAMLGLPAPPEVAFGDAGLPPAAAGFYAENRRIRPDRLLALPGFALRYPDWRAGYAGMIAAGE
ncbi:MAG: SDR family NAD(P)-dependent oxidoreductase [Paracoccus sp. (in: a-proteobacteria)]|uniref:NAD-dependent epimerase/dehydratase family protein n=1 Tax=Paracoccus sp. TaxID=267 RepID=UPI0026DEB946|nr:NAD-dependent epimerase/dehydratase family protein [Paracoccus sp. (in: a-proteobacteria)]MDO5614542.1 SDR family NAD(P)-dependent oxidoreductase [Paracoccus sp. (in: a-proteobacteria)]